MDFPESCHRILAAPAAVSPWHLAVGTAGQSSIFHQRRNQLLHRRSGQRKKSLAGLINARRQYTSTERTALSYTLRVRFKSYRDKHVDQIDRLGTTKFDSIYIILTKHRYVVMYLSQFVAEKEIRPKGAYLTCPLRLIFISSKRNSPITKPTGCQPADFFKHVFSFVLWPISDMAFIEPKHLHRNQTNILLIIIMIVCNVCRIIWFMSYNCDNWAAMFIVDALVPCATISATITMTSMQ